MKAKEYFDKEYGLDHIQTVVKLEDYISLYGLMEEFAKKYHKEQKEIEKYGTVNWIE